MTPLTIVGYVFQLILALLQIAMLIWKKWDAWNDAQKALCLKRFADTAETFRKLIDGAHDGLNEEAFLRLQDDETKVRYEQYKRITIDALANGYGLTQMQLINSYGYGQRVTLIKGEILLILSEVLNQTEKSQKIAALLSKC